MKLISIKEEKWEEELSEEKRKEILNEVEKEVEELYRDLDYKASDIGRIIERVQEAKDAIDTFGEEEDNTDNRREVPWYLEEEYSELQKVIEELEEKQKEIEGYREVIMKLLKFVELVKDKLSGQFNVKDVEGVIDIVLRYGHVSVLYSGFINLASIPIESSIAVKDLIASAITLRNIKSIIMGILINMSLQEGEDMYEGVRDEVRSYIKDRFREILRLFEA